MLRFIVSSCVFTVVYTSAFAGSSYPYTVVDLGSVQNSFSTVPRSLNANGEVVGWVQGPQSQTRAFMWSASGGIQELPSPSGYDYNIARGISATGIIVGHAKIGILGTERAWRIQNGNFQWLGSIVPNGFSEAWGCNDAGDVAGVSAGSGFQGNAFYYSTATGMVDLTPGQGGAARRVNNVGQVTGWVNSQVFRWSPGTGRIDLGALDGSHPITYGLAINDAGVIGGTALTASGHSSLAFLHFPDTGYLALPPVSTYNEVAGMNNRGEVVGFSGNSAGVGPHSWIWSQQDGLRMLNTMIDPAEGYTMTRAFGINDAGQIIGLASRVLPPYDGFNGGVILVPTTPPLIGDTNGDGIVNVTDLLAVINSWGACPAPPAACSADINDDGMVNVTDLLLIINNWS